MLWRTGTVELVLLYVKSKGVDSQAHPIRIDATRTLRASRLIASEVAHRHHCATTLLVGRSSTPPVVMRNPLPLLFQLIVRALNLDFLASKTRINEHSSPMSGLCGRVLLRVWRAGWKPG